jgi:hypothetical protein
MVAAAREPLSTFAEALDAESDRKLAGWQHIWHYTGMGFYHQQLQRYLAECPREQLLVLFHEDLLADAAGTLARICRFIGVDDSFRPPSDVHPNASGAPRSRTLQRMLARPGRLKRAAKYLIPREVRDSIRRTNLARVPMTGVDRSRLVEVFRDDVGALANLCDRDLSSWLRV